MAAVGTSGASHFPLCLSLVFKGELGEERDAVAYGYKDISEPTPFMSLNNTDYVCLKKDGTNNWYQNGDPVLNAIQDEKHCLFHPFTFHIKSVAFNGLYASSSNFFKKYETPPLVEANDSFVFHVLGDTDKEIKCSVWIEGKREPGQSYCHQSSVIPNPVYSMPPYQNKVHVQWEMVEGSWKPDFKYTNYRLRKFRGHRFYNLVHYDISYPNLTSGDCDSNYFITDPAAGAQNVRTSDENQATLPDSGNIVQINLTEADG
jgi:hypothetical protein